MSPIVFSRRLALPMVLQALGFAFPIPSSADVAFDVLGPSTCQLRSGRLARCSLEQSLPILSANAATRIPLRSEFRFERTGDCRTQFPLVLHVEAAGSPPGSPPGSPIESWSVPFLDGSRTELRRSDSRSLGGSRITFESTWLSRFSVDASCRIRGEVALDVPAVRGASEAATWVGAIESDFVARGAARDNLRELIRLRGAFKVLWEVTEVFRSRLIDAPVSNAIGDLDAAAASLEQLTGSASLPLSAAERSLIERLIQALPALRTPESWQGKSLVEFFPEADQVAIAALAESLRPRLGSPEDDVKRAELAKLEEEILGLCREASVMRTQLQPWSASVEALDSLKTRFSCVQ